MPVPDDTSWATEDLIHYGPPAGTHVRSRGGRMIQASAVPLVRNEAGDLVPAAQPPQESEDGEAAMGPAYDPPRNPGPNVAGLTFFASNGEEVQRIGAPSVPYGPMVAQVRPGLTPGADLYAPTTSVFGNDLRITRGPGHHARAVPAVKVDRERPRRRWGHMRPQPIPRQGHHDVPPGFPERHQTFSREGVFR